MATVRNVMHCVIRWMDAAWILHEQDWIEIRFLCFLSLIYYETIFVKSASWSRCGEFVVWDENCQKMSEIIEKLFFEMKWSLIKLILWTNAWKWGKLRFKPVQLFTSAPRNCPKFHFFFLGFIFFDLEIVRGLIW